MVFRKGQHILLHVAPVVHNKDTRRDMVLRKGQHLLLHVVHLYL